MMMMQRVSVFALATLLLGCSSKIVSPSGPAHPETEEAATSAEATSPAGDVVFNPRIDKAVALKRLRSFRLSFAENDSIVKDCQSSSETDCNENKDCVLEWDTAADELSQEQICRATDTVFHAWQQESRRRQCDNSENGVWQVYQSTSDRLYGDCKCQPADLIEFIKNGYTSFSQRDGKCQTDRENCTEGGKTFHSPKLVLATQHPILAKVPGANAQTAFDCVYGSYPTEKGLFIYPQWIEDKANGHCEMTVLYGFLIPHVQTGFDAPMPQGYSDFETHWCEEDH